MNANAESTDEICNYDDPFDSPISKSEQLY